MDKETLFQIWAPPASPWSTWAKPSLFAHFNTPPASCPTGEPIPISCIPPSAERTALVAVLPGQDAVAFGIAAAESGYRPVPLFNSCPPRPLEEVSVWGSAVDASVVLAKLACTATTLTSQNIPADAPPAFLIDSGRTRHGEIINDRMFDNRSVVFAADFPSANFLRSHGIARAVIVHDAKLSIADDLRYALKHWVSDGLKVNAVTLDNSPIDVSWPSDGFWGELRQRWKALVSFRRNPLGGYGGFMPELSGG